MGKSLFITNLILPILKASEISACGKFLKTQREIFGSALIAKESICSIGRKARLCTTVVVMSTLFPRLTFQHSLKIIRETSGWELAMASTSLKNNQVASYNILTSLAIQKVFRIT